MLVVPGTKDFTGSVNLETSTGRRFSHPQSRGTVEKLRSEKSLGLLCRKPDASIAVLELKVMT